MNPDGNQDPNSGDGDAWYGVAVTIVPHASAIQASISAALESTKEPARTGCDWGICFSEDVINDYWVDAEVIGTGDPANGVSESAQGVFDAVTAAANTFAPAAAPDWPAESSAWPTTCDGLVSVTTIADSLSLPGASFTVGYSYRSTNIPYGSVEAAKGLVCGIAREGGGRSGSIVTVPGAGGAFAASWSAATSSDDVEIIEVPGLPADSAFLRRPALTPNNATLDMNLHGTWVELSMGTTASDGPDAAARLQALAAAMAAQG
ncbi:hypothetical protein [Plantibacter sp. YIM 135347]|uniref:hypothetical protein n=1 Tax=Plantibacter sp. YIM 135347 TaxID=3423919 RepID=UPI003D339496